jgi:hypothetical protein
VLTAVGVGLYLVEALLSSCLVLGPLRIKGGADLGEGFLRDPRLLFPCGEGFLPLRKLLLSHEEQLQHLLNRHHRGRARRRRRGEGHGQSERGQVSNASVNTLTYHKGQPETYLLAAFTQ